MEHESFVYILTNQPRGTLYIGVTSALIKRVWEHRNGFIKSFSSKYKLNLLVYYEVHHDIYSAISREKQLKKWNRLWKIDLIEKGNPEWKDLYQKICG